MKLSEKKKIALVLSGGGIKAAAFHIGVCLALKEKGFRFAGGTKEEVAARYTDDSLTFRTYVGSSAGSVISTFLAAGFSLSSIIHAFETGSHELSETIQNDSAFDQDLRPLSYRDIFSINGRDLLQVIPSIFKSRGDSLVSGGLEVFIKNGFKLNGLFTTKGLERYFREEVWPTNTFQSLGVDLFVVGTQLNQSRKVIFGNKDLETKDKTVIYANYATVSDAVAASASLPPVFAPYPIKNKNGENRYFFDGEIRDTMSTHVAADHGADLVIASYSIQPYHFSKQMGSLHEYGIPVVLNQALYQVIEQKIEQSIKARKTIASIYKAVDGYLKQINLPPEHREKLLSIITERANFHPNTDYIYIHPDPHDHSMFFADHFSLNPQRLKGTVWAGFKSALNALRKYDI
ncbi:MAG: patatin-like phospholipase family protein [Bdellovibrionaceae bacterium]|nr:patatin-like phospholipase family protein [Pseudobdellovibrionaceae bacterium]